MSTYFHMHWSEIFHFLCFFFWFYFHFSFCQNCRFPVSPIHHWLQPFNSSRGTQPPPTSSPLYEQWTLTKPSSSLYEHYQNIIIIIHMTNTITIAIIDNIDTIITHIIIIICMSFRLDFSPEENYYSFNHNQMTIFKWLHLAFSFWELMQKKTYILHSTNYTSEPSTSSMTSRNFWIWTTCRSTPPYSSKWPAPYFHQEVSDPLSSEPWWKTTRMWWRPWPRASRTAGRISIENRW